MRLLFLAKRRPQQRDLLTRPYGRFHYLPIELARRGHDVSILLLDYQHSTGQLEASEQWSPVKSIQVINLWPDPSKYFRAIQHHHTQTKTDWVICCSDLWFGIAGWLTSLGSPSRLCIDAYDNFESYIPIAKPIHQLWRKALQHADLITAAGPQLATHLSRNTQASASIIPMAADPIFKPSNLHEARKQLQLPKKSTLIGYCGSADKKHDIQTVFEALEIMNQNGMGATLVMSGRSAVRLPDRAIHLGYLDDACMPSLLNAMSVLCIPGDDNSFGQFSYPSKLYEALACKKPLVAADTGPNQWILGPSQKHCTYPIGSAEQLAKRLTHQALTPEICPRPASWCEVASDFETSLMRSMKIADTTA